MDTLGLHTTEIKVEAALKAPNQKNINELLSFLGLLLQQIPAQHIFSIMQPLNQLLISDVKWKLT